MTNGSVSSLTSIDSPVPKWSLAAMAFVFFPTAILAHKGLAPLLALAAIAVLAHWASARAIDFKWGPFTWSYGALMAFSAISAIWSIAPVEALKTVPAVAAIGIGGMLSIFAASSLPEGSRALVRRALIAGCILGLAFIAIEIATGGAIDRLVGRDSAQTGSVLLSFNPTLSIAAVLLWPCFGALRREFSAVWAGLWLAAGTVVLIFSEADAPAAAIFAGLALFGISWVARRHLAKVLTVLIVAGTAAMPVVAVLLPNPLISIRHIEFLSPSAQHRLVIWRTAVKHIETKPVFGHGFDTSRALYSQKDAVLLRFAPDNPDLAWNNLFAPIPLHPHNGILQVWLELGAVGAAIVCALLIAVVLAIERYAADRFDRSMCYGAFGAAMFSGLVSFGTWQNWWMSGLFLCAALIAAVSVPAAAFHRARDGEKAPRP